MANFNFNLRDSNSKTSTPINLVVRWNNKRLVYSTGLKIKPSAWNDKKQEETQIAVPKGKTKSGLNKVSQDEFNRIADFNIQLQDIIGRAEKVFNDFTFINKRTPYNEAELRESLNVHFNPVVEEKPNFFKYFEEYIATKTHTKTKQWYENTLRQLKTFNSKLEFDSIDLSFYSGFVNAITEKGLAKNTIAKHIQNLKAYLNWATDNNKNTNLIFRSKKFKKETEESMSIAMSEQEVEEIYKLDLKSNTRLDRVRDLFIVACRTGLRFSDFQYIDQESFKKDFIHIQTKKTSTEVVIPIHTMVKQIRLKYKNKTENALPEPMSNQKFNEYIKEVTKKIDSLKQNQITTITKGGKKITTKLPKHDLISSHTGRRTFATLNYERGVPVYSIMSITAHKTESSFLKYVKTTPEKHAKILAKYWTK